jgi:hypothetical protein
MYKLNKIEPECINHLNRSVTINNIAAVKKSLPTKKSSGSGDFTAEF